MVTTSPASEAWCNADHPSAERRFTISGRSARSARTAQKSRFLLAFKNSCFCSHVGVMASTSMEAPRQLRRQAGPWSSVTLLPAMHVAARLSASAASGAWTPSGTSLLWTRTSLQRKPAPAPAAFIMTSLKACWSQVLPTWLLRSANTRRFFEVARARKARKPSWPCWASCLKAATSSVPSFAAIWSALAAPSGTSVSSISTSMFSWIMSLSARAL
mmetsp:Transcript_50424/g.144138  ORF Transcript_50424/g.144138 Transcript_50424/m.144138 type:complete len:216 (-) Transcript_50424:398-1045(-)